MELTKNGKSTNLRTKESSRYIAIQKASRKVKVGVNYFYEVMYNPFTITMYRAQEFSIATENSTLLKTMSYETWKDFLDNMLR